MVLFGFFSLILVLIYWINRAVVLFDQLIADGQSFWVFLEFTALSLPSVIRLAAPLAAFAAAIYVTNRMTTESELVVVQATGYSSFRLARPVLYFGIIVAILMSILLHFLVPISTSRLTERQNEIAQTATARLFTEGQFIEPVDGVSFYIREISADGELLDIFLSDTRDPTEHVIYTAKKAFLIRDSGQTQLVMLDGLVQTLIVEDQRLFVTSFEDFAYNVGTLVGAKSQSRRSASELSTLQLLNPTPALTKETRNSAASMIARGHDRFSQSLLGAVAALLGFATLIVGGFSRFGVWKQIVAAIVLIVLVKAAESVGLNLARTDENLWFMAYLPIITGGLMIWALLFVSGRPYLFKRRTTGDATT